MQPGDLRRFKGDMIGSMSEALVGGGTFVVLRVDPATERIRGVDILIDDHVDEGLGYFWVEDSSETINEDR